MQIRFLGAVVSAMLLAIAFPLTLPEPPMLWGVQLNPIQLPGWDAAGGFAQLPWLAFIALIPLFEICRTSRRPVEAYLWAYLCGFLWLVLHLDWFSSFGVLPVILSAMYLAIPVGIFGWLAHLVLHQPSPAATVWGLPVIWTALEYLRTFGTWTMPWNFIGYTQVRDLPLAQLASFGGVFAVSFAVVLVNSALYCLLHPLQETVRYRYRVGMAAAAGALICACLAFGELRLGLASTTTADADAPLTVALVQGGEETLEDWTKSRMQDTLELYVPPSEAALAAWQAKQSRKQSSGAGLIGPQRQDHLLVIWPESALPVAIEPRSPAKLPYTVQAMLQPHPGAALLMGALGRPKSPKRPENGCMLIEPDGRMQWPYSKVRLVPYGEVVPFRGLVRFLQYPWGSYDLCQGRSLKPLKWNEYTFGLMVCYDNCWSFIAREQVRQGAQALVLMTNNSWYKLHSGIRQHCDLDVMRAIETRRPLIRCSTTGWSHIIDAYGRVRNETQVNSAGHITSALIPGRGQTPYIVLGDLFAQLCVLATFILGLRQLFSARSEGFL